jgi:hypothetical protein
MNNYLKSKKIWGLIFVILLYIIFISIGIINKQKLKNIENIPIKINTNTSTNTIIDIDYNNKILSDYENSKCSYEIPQFIEGCEGEGCGLLSYDKSIKPVTIYKEPNINSEVVDRLKKCEVIKNFKIYMWIKKFGEAKILSPNLFENTVIQNDLIKVRYYSGEGYYSACVKNKEIIVADKFVADKEFPTVDFISNPVVEGWVRLTTPRGIDGYTPDTDFYIGYYDDEPSDCP